MNTQTLIDFVTNWRTNNGITGNQPLTTAQIQTFAIDLQAQVGQFSVRPEGAGWSPTAQPLGYQGWIDNIPNWKIAQAIAHGSGGQVFYISDTPAGDLLNDRPFKKAVSELIDSTRVGAGDTIRDNLFNGVKDASGNSTPYGIGNTLALNDFVSQKMMSEGAYGDMRILTTDIAPNSVLARIEIPDMLNNPKVTHINGIPKDLFLDILNENGGINNGMPEVLKAISATSTDLTANFRIAFDPLDPTGNSIKAVESISFYEGSSQYAGTKFDANTSNVVKLEVLPKLTPNQSASFVEGMESLKDSAQRLSARFASAGGIEPIGTQALLEWGVSGLNKLVSTAGAAAIGVTGMIAVHDAQEAINAGDNAKAATIVADYAIDLGAAFAGFAAGSSAAGAYFFWLEAVPVVGTAAHGVVTLAGGIGGAYLGTKGVEGVKNVIIDGVKRLAGVDPNYESDYLGMGDISSGWLPTTAAGNILTTYISQSGSGTLNWPDPLPDPGRPSSASFVTLNNGTHTAVIGQPSIRPVTGDIDRPGISDVFEQQKNSPNGFSNRSEFYAAVLKNNPSITDINLVHPGQTIQVPEKSPDGTVTYHFAGGIDASVNPIAGEYLVVLPKEGGGYTLYKRGGEFTNETDRLLARYPAANVKIETYDKNDTLTGEAVAKQDGLNGEVTPIASQIHATNPDGTLATGAKASTTDVQMLANGIVQTQTTTPVTAPDGTINGTQTTHASIVNGIPTALQTNTTVTNPTTHETTLSQDTTQYSLSGQLTGRTVISQVSNGAGEVTGGLSLSYNGAGQITATSLTQTIPNGVQQTNSTVVNGQITATTVSASAATATAPASTTQAVVFTDGQGRMTASNDRNNRLSA